MLPSGRSRSATSADIAGAWENGGSGRALRSSRMGTAATRARRALNRVLQHIARLTPQSPRTSSVRNGTGSVGGVAHRRGIFTSEDCVFYEPGGWRLYRWPRGQSDSRPPARLQGYSPPELFRYQAHARTLRKWAMGGRVQWVRGGRDGRGASSRRDGFHHWPGTAGIGPASIFFSTSSLEIRGCRYSRMGRTPMGTNDRSLHGVTSGPRKGGTFRGLGTQVLHAGRDV